MPPDSQPAQSHAARRLPLITRAGLIRSTLLLTFVATAFLWCACVMTKMPGVSAKGPLAPPTERQARMAESTRTDVTKIAGEIGPRDLAGAKRLGATMDYITTRMSSAGFADHREIPVEAGAATPNLEFTLNGTTQPEKIIVLGAHYDTCGATPGADDNASGVAALLAIADELGTKPRPRTIRLVFFVNEEPPMFQTKHMGSLVYAKACKAAGDDIRAMLALESMGYFDAAPGSQKYPAPFSLLYPSTGDFLAFVGNYDSRDLVRRCVKAFRSGAALPSEGAAVPGAIAGVGWSDHWSFWQEGWPAVMVTDTAPFRNPHYHEKSDTPDKLDYDRLGRAADGLIPVIDDLASETGP